MCVGAERPPPLKKVGRFDDLLTDDRLFAAFEQFLGREFAQENLQFYRDVIGFETAQHADKKMVKKHAQELVNRYLGGGGQEQQLNLNLRQISKINATLKKKPTIKLFAEAKQDIEQLLRTKFVAFCSE